MGCVGRVRRTLTSFSADQLIFHRSTSALSLLHPIGMPSTAGPGMAEPGGRSAFRECHSAGSHAEEAAARGRVVAFLNQFRDFERSGVPKNAGIRESDASKDAGHIGSKTYDALEHAETSESNASFFKENNMLDASRAKDSRTTGALEPGAVGIRVTVASPMTETGTVGSIAAGPAESAVTGTVDSTFAGTGDLRRPGAVESGTVEVRITVDSMIADRVDSRLTAIGDSTVTGTVDSTFSGTVDLHLARAEDPGTARVEGQVKVAPPVFDLARMHDLVAALGNPLERYRVVHVAGTKGKGSTSAFTAEILRASGLSVGVYSSPHLVRLGERIQGPSGRPLAWRAFDGLIQRNAPAVLGTHQRNKQQLSAFEVVTALAFRHFADEKVDVAVIEVGLGGAMDATNVIPPASLAVSVITAIGLDHVDALGGSMASIARAKAGIMKAGKPVVLGPQQHAAAVQELISFAVHASAGPVVRVVEAQEEEARHNGAISASVAASEEGSGRDESPCVYVIGGDMPLLEDDAGNPAQPVSFKATPSLMTASGPSIRKDPSARHALGNEHTSGSPRSDLEAAASDTRSTKGVGAGRIADSALDSAADSAASGAGDSGGVAGGPSTVQAGWELPGVRLRLLGRHMAGNAGTAVAAALVLRQAGFSVADRAIQAGLETAALPGRFQVLGRDDVETLGLQSATAVVLDGAHSADSAAALGSTIGSAFGADIRLHYVVAMASDKEHGPVLASLLATGPRPVYVLFTEVNVAGSKARSMPAASLEKAFSEALEAEERVQEPPEMSTASDFDVALCQLQDRIRGGHKGAKTVVCFAGSLHLVAMVLKCLGWQE